MNPEVIFVFVVLAIINSLFNKNKVQKKQQQRRTQQMQNQQNQNQQESDKPVKNQQRKASRTRDSEDYGLSERRKEPSSENSKKSQPQPQRQRPRSLLEEVLEQYNIREDHSSSKPKEESPKKEQVEVIESSIEDEHYTDYSRRDQPKKSRKKKEMKGYSKSRKKGVESGELSGDFFEKTSVEKSEIGADGFSELLKFDQQALVRGIIMSEILEKPKSMRKKKVG